MNAVADEVKNADSAEATETVTKTKHKKQKTDDLLVQIVQEISALDAADALETVPSLLDGAEENYFRLGGVLSLIQAQKFYQTEGFETFKQFVELKHAIPYRKAMYWIQIYSSLVESDVSWEKVKNVGWTKLKDLAPILTVENVDEWVVKALEMTVLQLQDAIAKAKAGTLETSGVEPTDDHKSPVTTFTVKVHEDQKVVIREAIDKAKKDANTEYDGVALEGICANYLTGGNVNKPTSLDEFLKKHSPESILVALEKLHPDIELTIKFKKS